MNRNPTSPAAETIVKAACPHDCPDTCALEVHVKRRRRRESHRSGCARTDGRRVVPKSRVTPSVPITQIASCIRCDGWARRDRVTSSGRPGKALSTKLPADSAPSPPGTPNRSSPTATPEPWASCKAKPWPNASSTAGFAREDLFTVVLELFQTDTADYADLILPATTQLEHLDVVQPYGHYYMVANNPAIGPLGESKPNTEIFRPPSANRAVPFALPMRAQPCLRTSEKSQS
jgi:Molybdopterin oxidoreductase